MNARFCIWVFAVLVVISGMGCTSSGGPLPKEAQTKEGKLGLLQKVPIPASERQKLSEQIGQEKPKGQ